MCPWGTGDRVLSFSPGEALGFTFWKEIPTFRGVSFVSFTKLMQNHVPAFTLQDKKTSFTRELRPPPVWQPPACYLCLRAGWLFLSLFFPFSVHLFCLLSSTYRGIHVLIVFLWLIYFTLGPAMLQVATCGASLWLILRRVCSTRTFIHLPAVDARAASV